MRAGSGTGISKLAKRLLKGIAGIGRPEVDETAIANRVRQDLIQQLSAGITGTVSTAKPPATPETAAAADYEQAYVDTPECTACDECININPKIFAYDTSKKAVVINPKAGSFLDIVKAAEKCTAGIIHPGTPWNMNEANLGKLELRAAKFH